MENLKRRNTVIVINKCTVKEGVPLCQNIAGKSAGKLTFSYTVEKNAMETNFPNSNLEISTGSFCPVIILLQIALVVFFIYVFLNK